MSHWKRGFTKVSATTAFSRGATQDKDEAYDTAARIPPPDPPTQYIPHQHGENASYYTPAPETQSPFSPATHVRGHQYAPPPPQPWTNNYHNVQPQQASQSPYVYDNAASPVSPPPMHQQYFQTVHIPQSPPGAQIASYHNSFPLQQAPITPPQRCWTYDNYNQTSPPPIQRSYTVPACPSCRREIHP